MNCPDNQIQKPKGVSGFTVSRNVISLDYPLPLCIESMLPVCDEVIVGDMSSDDGTLDLLHILAAKEPKLRIVEIHDWTKQRANPKWFVEALQEAREYCKFATGLQLDADEVLSDDPETRRCIEHTRDHMNAIAMDRINFVRDAKSVIPEGECCGRFVVRCGPSHLYWPSDEPHPRGEIHLLDMSYVEPRAKIFHLGFLRNRDAFFAKAKVVLGAFFGEFDERLARAERDGAHPFAELPWWNRLTPYTGNYPDSVRQWMTERGYVVPPNV